MPTRQELYDRIRKSLKDEVILDEMIRLGFWPRDGEMPLDPADDVRRKAELQRQIRELTSENKQLQDAEALKRAARKQRLEESRRKRKETKQRWLRERAEKAEAWRQRKETEIVYLGDGVSAGLGDLEANEAKLRAARLPLIRTPGELAEAMEISIGELRFLAFHRRASQTTHYRRFAIRKKTGGLRQISAPMPRLKRAQEWILRNILEHVELHVAAHGFRRGRSIVSNARPHVGADVVINIDLEDFFPTVTYRRIKGAFRSLGYGEAVATVLALVCSEPKVAEVQLDGRTYFVHRGERFLPQGAPTSPAITNIICRGLDARLVRTAAKLGFRYTRYADDITFSGSGSASENVGIALRRIRYAVRDEGFQINPRKTRILRRGRRQEVTGLVVNRNVHVPRCQLRRFRATLFQIERDGPAGKRWGNSDDVIAAIEGYANFVAMVDPKRGEKFQGQVRRIIDIYGRGKRRKPQRNRWRPKASVEDLQGEPETAAKGATMKKKKKPWWKFW